MSDFLKYTLSIFLLLLFVTVLFFINRPEQKDTEAKHRHMEQEKRNECIECLKKSYEERVALLNSSAYLERYIEDIINNGSSQSLGYAYGDMQGGFADKEAAPKIASYVVTLSGRRPTHPEWVKEGQTFYISNCGGCHGEDGKGVHGTFPDLTKDPLIGIKRRLERAKADLTRRSSGVRQSGQGTPAPLH